MMPHLAERSIRENVLGASAAAAVASFASKRRRRARTWCRRRCLRLRLTAVRRSAMRTRLIAVTVFAMGALRIPQGGGVGQTRSGRCGAGLQAGGGFTNPPPRLSNPETDHGKRYANKVSFAVITTYCLPSLPRYVIGFAKPLSGSLVSHSSFPVLDS